MKRNKKSSFQICGEKTPTWLLKKITAFIILLSFAVIPAGSAAAPDVTGYKLLAYDNFADYTLPDGRNAAAIGVTFQNFPAKGESMIDQGTGWASPWSLNNATFTNNFGEGNPQFINAANTLGAYYYGGNLYRKFKNSLSGGIDNEIYIRFTMISQRTAIENNVGISLFNDNVRIGLWGKGERDSALSNPQNAALHPNYPAITVLGNIIKNEDVAIAEENSAYTYIAKITLNSSGEETFKLKVFPRGDNEPAEWHVETSADIGNETADYLRLLCFTQKDAAIWENIYIYQKNIALGAEVGSSAPNKANLTDGMKNTSANTEEFFVDLGAKYRISDIGLFFADTGNGEFSVYGANSDDRGDGVLLAEETGIVDESLWKAAVTGTGAYQYIFFSGNGSYNISEITVFGIFAEKVFAPTFRSRDGSRLLDGGYLSIAEERLYFKFDEAVNPQTLNGAVSVKRGDNTLMPVNTAYDAASYTAVLHLSEALNDGEKYTVTMENAVKSAAGKPLNKTFVSSVYGKKSVTEAYRRGANLGQTAYHYGTVNNETGTDLAGALVSVSSRGGNIAQIYSSVVTTITKNSSSEIRNTLSSTPNSDIIDGYFIKNWASLAPIAELAPIVDGIAIDEITNDDCEVTVKGTVTTENGYPFNGRDIIAAVTPDNKTLPAASGVNTSEILNISYGNSGLSNGAGKFTATVKLNDGTPSGMYKAFSGTNYAGTAAEKSFFFMMNERSREIVDLYNQTSGAAAMTALIESTSAELSINLAEKTAGINDFDKVSERITGRRFSSPREIMDAVYAALSIESVNQAASGAALGAQIIARASDIGINLEKYDALIKNMGELPDSTPFVDALWDAVYSAAPFETVADLKDKLAEQLDIQLQARHPIDRSDITANSVSVNVGQIIEIPLKSSIPAGITSAEIKITYDSALLTLNGVKKAPVFDNAVINTGTVGIITVKLNDSVYTLPSGEILKLSFIQKKPAAMSSSINVDAVIKSYDEFLTVDRTFYTNISANITAAQITTHPSGSGTGGGGGISMPLPAPTPSPTPQVPFTDLDNVGWAVPAISYLAEKGIVSGVGAGIFEPNRNVTREEFVKMLVGAFKLEDNGAELTFGDVSENDWYYTYISAAVANNIVLGYGDGRFGVGDSITREQMSAMAYRTAVHFAPGTAFSPKLDFDDSGEINDWATEAVGALVSVGVINGVGENMFAPRELATRAQAAQVIYKVLKLFDPNIA
jgi:hypothetical protein